MFDIFDIKEIYLDKFAEYLNGVERFCPVIDENVLLSHDEKDDKICSYFDNCKNKDTCKFIKQ